MMTAEILAHQIGYAKRNHRRRSRCGPLHPWLGRAALQRRIYYFRSVSKRPLPHFRPGNQIAVHKSTLARWLDRRPGGQPMIRRTLPGITVDRHMTLGNRLKDVFEELVDIMDNSGADDLIVRWASNAVVAINRLKTALEYELTLTIPLELDPRCILEQIYYGGGRFQLCSVEGEPDAFAPWREVLNL